MRGAVAAGHELTAEAGARILMEGGNAVDACIAAAFTSWVAESPLTGLGAGGFMLVQRAGDASTYLLDFFAATPGLGAVPHERAEMEAVDVEFEGGETRQSFRIGSASCAVPGTAAGLAAAHQAAASLPWRALLEPAVELARTGVILTPAQADLHAILDVILRHTGEGSRVYGTPSGRLTAGDRLVLRDLAGTLELLAETGPDVLYRGELARAIVEHLRETGGEITLEDLAAYRVIRRRPVQADFREHVFASNPPPSSGGVLIAYGLRLLDRLGLGGGPGSAGASAVLIEVMREQSRVRSGSFAGDLHRGGLVNRLLSAESVETGVERIGAGLARSREAAAVGGTTHISVLDGAGNAASLSASTGSGSGVIVPGTGIHLNNMLGEHDLNPRGRAARPGRRLTSMMSPSIVLAPGFPRLVVGSAGSVRLRGAILQVVANVVGHGLPVAEAIERPRIHLDEPHVHCEGPFDPAELRTLEQSGYDLVRWGGRNLFFGGVAAVERRGDGSLAAAGDSRRGGHGIVVP